MGSCHNSVEMQEPSQPLVEQFSEFLFNRDSEQQQLLPCLDHIMDPAGSGVVQMFQDDNAGFVRSGDVGMEIVSGDRGTGLVGGTENLDGLAEDCDISGVCLNESQNGFGDCDVETNGLHFGKIENRGGGMEPGTHNKIVPSVSCGINTKFMPVSGSPRTCAQLDDQKIAKNGMVQQKKSHILGATDSYTFDDRASSPRCRSPEDLIPDNSSLHHAQLDDWKDDETGCVQGIMEERSKSLVAVEADSCNSMVPSSGYKMAQEENQKEFVAHQQIVEEEADHLAASEANPHEALESSLFWQMHEDFSLVSSSAINFGQQDEQKYDKSGCVQVIMEKKSDVLDVLEGVTSDELVSPPGCTSGVLPANDISRNCVEREKQNYVCTSHGKILDRSVDLLETWTDNDNHNLPSTTSAMLSDLLTVSPSSFLQQDDKRAVECSSQSDNERGDDAKIAYFSERKGDNIISFQGSSRKSKSGRKTLTKQAVRKSRDVTKVPDQHESVETILKASRRKRSCFSKPARISSWGLLGNITQNFKLSNGLGFDKIKNVDTHNATVSHRREKRKKNGAGGSSQRSNHEHYASTGRIRLKVKLGNQVGQNGMNILVSDPEVLDTSLSADAFITNDGIQSYRGTSSVDKKLCNGVEDEVGEEQNDNHVQGLDNELDKTNSDAPIVHVRLSSKDLQCSVFSEKSAGDAAEDVVPSHIEVEALAVIEKGYSDPGTSPDSEVINLVPDRQVAARSHEDSSSKGFTAPEGVIIGTKGKKKNQLLHTGNCFQEDGPPCAEIINKVKPTKKRGARQRKADLFLSSEILTSSASENASTNSWSCKEFSEEHLPSLTGIELETYMNTHTEAKICSALDVGFKLSESQDSSHLIPLAKSKGHQLLRKVDVMQKGQSKVSSSRRSRGGNSYKERGDGWKSISMNEEKGNSSSDDVLCKVEADLTTDDIGKTNSEPDITPVDVTNLDIASSGEVDHCLPVDSAWVRCDECHKWRRIAVALVDSIGHTNCQWVCKDNTDEAFAGCSIPQEKSNAEINVELGISDAEEDTYDFASNERGLEYRQTSVCKEYEFTRITTNQFLHRNRRSQTIDEIMVCHCKPPQDGSLGCGDECLNRMLNIECVQGTCPCGDLCSNQQFQKRSYAKMRWGRCGKKGFGLRMEDDIPKGQFLIEYVGEVLDMHTYEARQKEYAFRGHKHFYFMTLDGSEVIDASAKGNLGRFINHSCDPNCRTEKWVVNGEICIGLFALRDIKKGEELTFDYNYVRVVGAAAKKCYCGSPQCRGYIGGDPTSSEVIDQVDSDEEFPEPVMIDDGDGIDNTISETSCFDGDKMKNPTIAVGKLDVPTEAVDSVNQSVSALSQIHGALKMISSNQLIETVPTEEDTSKKPASAVQQEISNEETKGKTLGLFCAEETSPSTVLSKSSDSTVVNRKSKSTTAEDKRVFVKSQFFIKTSCESGCVKKGKVTTRVPIIANKSKLLTTKPKKLVESTSNCRFEAVQEKLNELLDADGGISKRKDSPKGYLKLLLLTAASGASRNGEAIQSNRELSMILDALLKTRSRVVLVDIINKNGLRMLHNILKQYRRDFKKIPILRKLLKVIEYLAVREILTQEHINGGPPCPGMERFTESMLSLTEHDDKQVHQIARSFRDRWIPRHVRRFSYIDREDGRMDFHRSPNYNRSHTLHNQVVRNSEAVDCVMKSKLATSSGDTAISDGSSIPCVGNGTKTRKRKSRWDQPAKENTGNVLVPIDNASKEYSYCRECFRNYSLQDGVGCADIRLNLLEDVPPGFSSPKAASIGNHLADESVPPLKGPIDVVVGLPQTKFISRLPMSYGVPLPIVQKCISPESEDFETWVIAPGMPFHPFPPLPSFPLFPCNRKEAADCVLNPMVINESAEQRALDTHDPATCCPNENNPSTTGANQPETDFPGANDHQTHKRAKGSSYDLGKRYFRQQKWNKVPPWLRSRNGWGGHIGDKSRGEMCSAETGTALNEHRNSYCSQDLSCRMGNTGGCFNQHAQHLDEN